MGKIFVPALPTAMVMERYLKSRANDQMATDNYLERSATTFVSG